MTIRRICTIAGRSYALTGTCATCGNALWTTMDTPIAHAGCTCDTEPVTPEPTPTPTPPVSSSDTDTDDSDTWTHPE